MPSAWDAIEPWEKGCLARGLFLLIAKSHAEFDLIELGRLARLATQLETEARCD